MASFNSSTSNARFPIPVEGFVFIHDTAIGQRVSAMKEANVPLQSVLGFAFLKENIVDNSDIIATLKSYLQCASFILGLYRTLGPVPGAYSFRRYSPGLSVESVLVHLLAKHSKIAIWKASHQVEFSVIRGKIGLFKADPAELEELGLERVEQVFENGGYCIRDTGVVMEVLEGTAITFAIGKTELRNKWTPMELDESLRSTVEEIQTPMFEINARFKKL